MLKAHKIRLNPTPEQSQYFWRAAGIARLAWNWGLAEYNRRKEAGEKVKITGKGETLKNEFSALKNIKYPFCLEVTTYAWQQAFIDLQKAINRYFDFKKKGLLVKPRDWKPRKDGKSFGWPRFKSRNRSTPAFYEANTGLRFDGNNVRLPKIGSVNMTEPLRLAGKVMGARITYSGGHWWISAQVDTPDEPPKKPVNHQQVEVDMGIRYLAVTSDGDRYENPKALPKAQAKLARFQQLLDRQRRANNPDNYNEDGTIKAGPKTWVVSNRMKKTEFKIARLHARIKNVRQDAAHKMTTKIATSYGTVVIEDLDLSQMLNNNPTAKWLADAALYEKRRQLEYKTTWNGGELKIVDTLKCTNKRCSQCGYVNDYVKSHMLTWTCQNCEAENDKYVNSNKNIKHLNTSPDYQDGDDKRTGNRENVNT